MKLKIRRQRVVAGDVFGNTMFHVVVLKVDGRHAICARPRDGAAAPRQTRIQVSRLQRELPRLGEVDTAAVHRALLRDLRAMRSPPRWAQLVLAANPVTTSKRSKSRT